jgi:hypothetical protein
MSAMNDWKRSDELSKPLEAKWMTGKKAAERVAAQQDELLWVGETTTTYRPDQTSYFHTTLSIKADGSGLVVISRLHLSTIS